MKLQPQLILLALISLITFSDCQNKKTPDSEKTLFALIGNSGSSGVAKFDLNTSEYLGLFVAENSGGLIFPDAITDIGNGTYIVSSGCRTTADSVCLRSESAILNYNGQTGEFIGSFENPEGDILYRPYGTELGPDNLIYVASLVNNSVFRYKTSGEFVDVFAHSSGQDSLGINGTNGLAFDLEKEFLYVTTEGATFNCDSLGSDSCVVLFTGDPSLILRYRVDDGSSSVFANPPIQNPKNPPSMEGILMAPDGKIYASDFTTNVVRVYDSATGTEERTIKIDLGTSCGVSALKNQYLGDLDLDDAGNIYLVVGGDTLGGLVKILAPDYIKVECALAPSANIDRPIGLHLIE